MNKVYLGDNLKILTALPSESVSLIYIDPPFDAQNKITRQNNISFYEYTRTSNH